VGGAYHRATHVVDFNEPALITVSAVYTFISTLNRSLILAVSVCSLAFNTSCTGSSSGAAGGAASAKENQPPVITSAKILTDPILSSRPLEVQVDAQDPEREAVSFQYQWYVNNTPLPEQTKASLPADQYKRGQTVFVEVVPTDGTHKGQSYRAKSIIVGNTSPSVTAVSLIPQAARTGDKLEAQVEASDPDHDRVDLTYKWYRNDAVIKEGEEPFLDTTTFAAHDKIMVEVTAHDPAVSGNSLKSELLVLGNSAPKIMSTPPTTASEDHFDYQVKAIDPDGDQLTYQLETAPPGMTIGAESGHIAWRFPSDQQGTFHVKLVAKDSQGGMAFQEFDLTLTAAIPPKPSGA
jgi:hypothetical protein